MLINITILLAFSSLLLLEFDEDLNEIVSFHMTLLSAFRRFGLVHSMRTRTDIVKKGGLKRSSAKASPPDGN